MAMMLVLVLNASLRKKSIVIFLVLVPESQLLVLVLVHEHQVLVLIFVLESQVRYRYCLLINDRRRISSCFSPGLKMVPESSRMSC